MDVKLNFYVDIKIGISIEFVIKYTAESRWMNRVIYFILAILGSKTAPGSQKRAGRF